MNEMSGVRETIPPPELAALALRMRQPATAEALLFDYVFHGASPKPRHIPSLMRIFEQVVALGHVAWPLELRGMCLGRDVLDFGCGSTLYGAAFRALGAKTYTGVDRALEPGRKKFRSRLLKKTVDLPFSLADVSSVIPGISYLRADAVTSREAWDVALLQSVTHQLENPGETIAQIARALREDGQIWILHENYYAWGGHQQAPTTPSAYDPGKPEHRARVDWRHVVPDPPEAAPRRMPLRIGGLREIVSRHFEISKWEEVPDRSAMRARLTDEVRGRLVGYSDAELLTRQVVCVGRKRR
ncbi:MAG: class I SAM-dependent methyltransferase [Elioraea tepidiphila]